MASNFPAAIQNENLPIHRGKGVEGAKAELPKQSKGKNQGRVALRDLSKTGKPAPSDAAKGSTLKGKSKARDAVWSRNIVKDSIWSDEEIRRCQEWAKEGIEEMHFAGNHQRKLEKEKMEEHVRKEVDKVMMQKDVGFDLGMSWKVPEQDDTFDVTKMELEPEELPPKVKTSLHSEFQSPLMADADADASRNPTEGIFLSKEEIQQCHEWANEGIEEMHFSGDDQRKLEEEQTEERVRKEVDKVMSALHEWTDMAFDLGFPPKVPEQDGTFDITVMDLEPEELPPVARYSLHSGKEELEDIFLESEFDHYLPYIDQTIDFKLKEDYCANVFLHLNDLAR